ncbi:unnamed protein product [Gongylonema pulchrum]|uniref:Glycosyl transferase n=1 Tax=Gongylonema pulchrum TaxID=637853 RepID=A0A183E9Q8_9BILA|nr:unnamed protein product [Gongylonema pulchrum]
MPVRTARDFAIRRGASILFAEIPVERLIRAKFQDNSEFLKCSRRIFDANYSGDWPDVSGVKNSLGKYKRIEEMATDAAYCQLTGVLFPGKLPLKKVKLVSSRENDWISNWRILQSVLDKIGVQKVLLPYAFSLQYLAVV